MIREECVVSELCFEDEDNVFRARSAMSNLVQVGLWNFWLAATHAVLRRKVNFSLARPQKRNTQRRIPRTSADREWQPNTCRRRASTTSDCGTQTQCWRTVVCRPTYRMRKTDTANNFLQDPPWCAANLCALSASLNLANWAELNTQDKQHKSMHKTSNTTAVHGCERVLKNPW